MKKPVLELNLDEPRERAFVTINGVNYELAAPDEVSVAEFGKMQAGMRLAFTPGTVPDDEAAVTLEELLDAGCRAVLKAPDEVHARLSWLNRAAVLNAYAAHIRGQHQQPVPPPAEEGR